MHNGMSLQEMLGEVVRQSEVKRDYIASTKENIAMVAMPGFRNDVAIVLQKPEAAELERFEMTDTFHEQLASRLSIPRKYYDRLLQDHRDLLMHNVNTLFQREPEIRMVRTLDGKARAFLSQQYRRVDNDEILRQTLPVVRNEFPTELLGTHVDENRMSMKCLFTGPEHQVIAPRKTRDGRTDVLHTGFEMGNSETGRGSFFIRGFLYRNFCRNGCVFGSEETVSYRQVHVGSKLGIGKSMLLSEQTARKEDELIISAARDVLAHLASPDFAAEVQARLNAVGNSQPVKDAQAAVEAMCKELTLTEKETRGALEAFIRDQDYTQWGMVNAVTEQANVTEDYNRATFLEEAGNKIINLPANRWKVIATVDRIAA